jgi:hypothetical protein
MTYARYMPDADPFDELLEEADEHPVDGWDFSWLGDRLIDHPLPWDYEAMLLDHAVAALIFSTWALAVASSWRDCHIIRGAPSLLRRGHLMSRSLGGD